MKKFLIIFFIFLVILAVGLFLIYQGLFSRKVLLNTEKGEYLTTEKPRLTIRNNLDEDICFSSCFPYYLEREEGNLFQPYLYASCLGADIIENCLLAGDSKTFELLLNAGEIKRGLHRAAVSVCIDCSLGGEFQEDEFFYSNEFSIK